MKNYNTDEILITGIGITSAIGQGKDAFSSALLQGKHNFGVMKRKGRQKETTFLGAEIQELCYPEGLSKKLLRRTSFTGKVALVTLQEAWEEAELNKVDPCRIGLVVGGSNVQQREMLQIYEAYGERVEFIRPTYGISFLDSDLCGLCTEQFGIKGLAYTVGGASASGQLAIIQAVQAVLCGQVDVCIALGALMDLSYLECQALRALGAMGSDRYYEQPELACRPFDKNHDGFIFGECCGAIVIERKESAIARHIRPYAAINGWAVSMDANRNPNPSYEGEVAVITNALKMAEIEASEVDYINPHGTGSIIGDETELRAIQDCGLSHAYINCTKSITGHGLTAAGAVEIIAVLLQMKEAQLHPTRNLEEPIDSSFNWVSAYGEKHAIKNALSLSIGFGGINTAICLTNLFKEDKYD